MMPSEVARGVHRAGLLTLCVGGSGPSLLYQRAELVNVRPGMEHNFFLPAYS